MERRKAQAEGGSEQAFKRAVSDILCVIDFCRKEERILPGLVLVYAGIDIMASLSWPTASKKKQGETFKGWVKKYLQPADLGCGDVDLWAARCGLLHAYSAESSLSDKGKARKIYYSWGNAKPEALQKWIDELNKPAVAVSVDRLFQAFYDALLRLASDMESDQHLAQKIYERANKILTYCSKDIVETDLA